jgi:hypothetical protein
VFASGDITVFKAMDAAENDVRATGRVVFEHLAHAMANSGPESETGYIAAMGTAREDTVFPGVIVDPCPLSMAVSGSTV